MLSKALLTLVGYVKSNFFNASIFSIASCAIISCSPSGTDFFLLQPLYIVKPDGLFALPIGVPSATPVDNENN